MILNGKGAANGIAVGRIFIYKKNFFLPVESFVPAGEEQEQLDRYLKVKELALKELEQIKHTLQKHDDNKAEIFTAQQEIIDDIVINEEIPAKILNERWSGDWAIYQVYETVIAVLQKTPDPLIAERAVDFEDVRTLLLKLWNSKDRQEPGQKPKPEAGLSALKEPAIIAAHNLMPSDTASMNRDNVLAILTEAGGINSHAAIIAKSYGIPTIIGIQGLLNTVKHGQLAAVNAGEGTVILDPEETVIDEYNKKSQDLSNKRLYFDSFLHSEARTADGVKIDIGLNIASVTDGELEAESYTDSVGLFRTEFLYMGKDIPDEDEQVSIYKKVLETYGTRPVFLRTLDAGGDKPLPYIEMPQEENPALGNRGLRFCFSHPEIFQTQIRAALRASVYGNLWLMLPMVGSIDDIDKAKTQIAAVRKELQNEGIQNAEIKIGIMIEIPSIALIADHAAKEADFASIGSNDLCQYLCAADRMNSTVENYYQSYHPAMFRLIKEAAAAFIKAGKPVSICGELAADTLALPLLIGLGIRKLSIGAASVAEVKQAISSITISKAENIAEKVLTLTTAAEVQEFLTTVQQTMATKNL